MNLHELNVWQNVILRLRYLKTPSSSILLPTHFPSLVLKMRLSKRSIFLNLNEGKSLYPFVLSKRQTALAHNPPTWSSSKTWSQCSLIFSGKLLLITGGASSACLWSWHTLPIDIWAILLARQVALLSCRQESHRVLDLGPCDRLWTVNQMLYYNKMLSNFVLFDAFISYVSKKD